MDQANFYLSTATFTRSLPELGQADLELTGGKGANLAALVNAGFPVPPGFCLTTRAYRAFVAANELEDTIQKLLAPIRVDDPGSLAAGSTQIRACFKAGQIPPPLAAEICRAYRLLAQAAGAGETPDRPIHLAVAVRSSATAEDLPDMSFAGQQDTYLNIVGEAALLQAVVGCWSSLWTARAIGYRARNGLSHRDVALAVVVQVMVQSEAAGVLFTANPLTGRRTETVIDATLGLGEALVSGQVEPDHYVVGAAGSILSQTLGAKALSIWGQSGGGTVQRTEAAGARPALPDAAILKLAALGRQVARHFGTPQDIEWAWAGERLYLVQSRPITSLYPLPANAGPEGPFRVLFSFASIQGMVEPFTPLGQDVFGSLVVGLDRRLGFGSTLETQSFFFSAGERLFIDLSDLLRHPVGRRVLGQAMASLDPVTREVLELIGPDPRLAARPARMGLVTRLRLVRLLAPPAGNVLFTLLWPARGRARLQNWIRAALEATQAGSTAAPTLAGRVAFLEKMLTEFAPALLPYLASMVVSGQAALQILLRLAAPVPEAGPLILELTRGLPYNVTTEMDLALWATARTIKVDAVATAYFDRAEAASLAADYLAGRQPATAQAAIARFMQRYGMRGPGEIDLGHPRWQEDPTALMQALRSYLRIEGEAQSPEVVFERGVTQARAAQDQLVARLRRQGSLGGRLKAILAAWFAGRVRQLGGLRESPKFTAIRLMGLLRTALLENGQQLAAEGVLARADDLFFLHLPELKRLAAGEQRDWRALIAARRETYDREQRRRRRPRLLLSDGTTFYEGAGGPATVGSAGANVITGSPVSAGVVEGVVRVVLDPAGAQLAPGEVLVCPATDPGWTPLFLAAGGLVMEIGGMMTHGSVVAREYGIPAVVGVSQATTRLKTGQRVRVDGSTGQVVVLPE